MALKIKWSDDRVQGATTAVLLLVRARLARGETEDLIALSLAEFRADPVGYKLRKKTWPAARELGPLVRPQDVAYYQNLNSAINRLLQKWTQAKRQFNSLLELDNALAEQLKRSGRWQMDEVG